MTGARVAAVGVVTGWGEGVASLPAEARVAAAGRHVVPAPRPALDGERFRRATRECLLAVAAAEAMLTRAGLDREAIAGPGTALVFVTAAGYGASNAEFIEGAGALHFPYTAPSAISAEVAIEYGLGGPYVILIGGPATTVDGLWQASLLLARRRCERAVVLAVETYAECAALWERGRWQVDWPLVEAAACALLVAGPHGVRYEAVAEPVPLEGAVEARAGQTLACGPLIALAVAGATGAGRTRVTGTWRGRRAGVEVDVVPTAA